MIEALGRLQPAERHSIVGRVDAQPIRQAHLRTYPYRIVFIETPDSIRVLAVAHTSRRPGYWLGRV